MTSFTGTRGMGTFRAIALKHGLKLYAQTGMRPNRAWTIGNMLAAASGITGVNYGKRGQVQTWRAIADREAWIEREGAAHGELSDPSEHVEEYTADERDEIKLTMAAHRRRLEERECGSARDLDRDLMDSYRDD